LALWKSTKSAEDSGVADDRSLCHDECVLRIGLYRVLLVLGVIACVVPPVVDLVAGHGVERPAANNFLIYIPFFLAGAFAFWKRPDQRAARRLLLVGALAVLFSAVGNIISVVYLVHGPVSWFWAANTVDRVLTGAFYAALIAMLAVFPDGHYHRRYERWMVWLWGCLLPVSPVVELLAHPAVFVNAYNVWAAPQLRSPLYVPALASLYPIIQSVDDQTLLPILIAALILPLRYWRSDPEQRQQVKWPLFVLLGFFQVPIAGGLAQLGVVPSALNNILFILAIVSLPVSFAIGIVKHRLLDIDLVIRKSIIYGALWLVIALTYAGLAALLGIAAGQRFPVGLAVALTIVAAMAFQPARRRLERLADRWVFGERLGGYELLQRFGTALEDTSDLTQLAPRVAATVREGLGVWWARIVMETETPEGPRFEAIGADGIGLDKPAQPEAVAALAHGDELVGRIECGPKVEGEWQRSDQDLLETLGRQAALAIRNAHLAAELSLRLEELEASRLRIIRAEDAERRRIERNIHDGVQQDLIALMAKIGLARTQLGGDPALVDATLSRLQEETRQALEELRELARGIHPPVLTDRGLLEAIEARAARLPLGITVETDRALYGRRFAEEIEGAAYFLVCEALTNTVKHAAAQGAGIRLEAQNGHLYVQVSDDGQGFDPHTTPRAGLAGLTDRIEALGGTVRIESRQGHGSTVSATLPARDASHG